MHLFTCSNLPTVARIATISLLAFCVRVHAGPPPDAADAEEARSHVSQADERRAAQARASVQTQQGQPARQESAPRAAISAANMGALGAGMKISAPADRNGVVRMGRDNATGKPAFAVGLPAGTDRAGATATVQARITADGSAVYPKLQPGTDVVVQAYTDSVRIATVLSGNEAPVEFSYKVDLPAGGKIERVESGGIVVLDAQGALVGGMAEPWAVDNAGKPVPTHYEVRGNSVVQVVEHRAANVQYPVVADPWMYIDLISSASWRRNDQYGWTMQVTPTRWARINAGGYLVGVAGWNELYDKYRNRGLNTNLGAMRDQFICHQQVVAVIEPNKATWNLDEWRPDVSYAATVNARGNPGQPGGGSIID